MQKLIESDLLTGDEYICWDINSYVKDFDYYYKNVEDRDKIWLYNQLEFKEYWKNLCTIYWPITTLSIMARRGFSKLERQELVKLRTAESDFDKSVGGYTVRGCDVARKWWNLRNPNNPIVTMVIENDSEQRQKLFGRDLPLVTSFRWNKAYNDDSKDGIVEGTSFSPTSYWHCRTIYGLEVLDNYNRKYAYPSIENYNKLVESGNERKQSIIFFFENELSQAWQKLVNAMKAGLWNWTRQEDLITRFEASRIALRIWRGKVKEDKIWNWKDWDKPASKFEYTQMVHNAFSKFKITSDTDRNQNLTRREAILMLP